MTVYISRDGSEALEHYGVKGMKWGVRRTPAQLGRDFKAKRSARKKWLKQFKEMSSYDRERSIYNDDHRHPDRTVMESTYRDMVTKYGEKSVDMYRHEYVRQRREARAIQAVSAVLLTAGTTYLISKGKL